MQIFVKVNNNTISIDVEPSDTIDFIKQKIREKTGISSENIQLISYNRPPPPSRPALTTGYVPGIGEVKIYPSGNS
jgi:hypothetical protein